MSNILRSILDLLAVEDAGRGTYIGPQPADDRERLRVFGGQVAAQAVMAASRSCAPATQDPAAVRHRRTA